MPMPTVQQLLGHEKPLQTILNLDNFFVFFDKKKTSSKPMMTP